MTPMGEVVPGMGGDHRGARCVPQVIRSARNAASVRRAGLPISSPVSKQAALLVLARKRRATRWEGYGCIGDPEYAGGLHECDFVSPYTKGASNVDADVFLLLQDWACHSTLRETRDRDLKDMIGIGRLPGLPTNLNLEDLLRHFLGCELQDTYATNLFPFVKGL